MNWKVATAFICGALCPFIVLGVAYWVYFVRGSDSGWPA